MKPFRMLKFWSKVIAIFPPAPMRTRISNVTPTSTSPVSIVVVFWFVMIALMYRIVSPTNRWAPRPSDTSALGRAIRLRLLVILSSTASTSADDDPSLYFSLIVPVEFEVSPRLWFFLTNSLLPPDRRLQPNPTFKASSLVSSITRSSSATCRGAMSMSAR